MNYSIGLRTRGRVYEGCVRSALLYGVLTSRLMDVLHRCYHRILSYMAGVKWQDRRSNSEMAEKLVLENDRSLKCTVVAVEITV